MAYTSIQLFRCEIKNCGKRFTRKHGLLAHETAIRNMHEDKAAYCDLCGKRALKSTIVGHIKDRHGGKERCRFCRKVFKNRNSRICHENGVCKITLLTCEICGEQFKTKKGYNNHRQRPPLRCRR